MPVASAPEPSPNIIEIIDFYSFWFSLQVLFLTTAFI